jgi:hypothetical protein
MKKFVLLALASWPLSLLAQGGLPDKPYLYVEEKAEIEKPADVVTLNFDLVARNPNQAKANQEELIAITGTEFKEITSGLTKEKELSEEIRLNALVNARERADKIAKGMGVTIDSVFAISSTPFPQILSTMFSSEYDEVSRSRTIVTGPPEYLFGPMTVSQMVHVIHLISPAK